MISGLVVQKGDNTIQWISCYPADKCQQNPGALSTNGDLYSG